MATYIVKYYDSADYSHCIYTTTFDHAPTTDEMVDVAQDTDVCHTWDLFARIYNEKGELLDQGDLGGFADCPPDGWLDSIMKNPKVQEIVDQTFASHNKEEDESEEETVKNSEPVQEDCADIEARDAIACAILYIKTLFATGVVDDGKVSADDLKRILEMLKRSGVYPETLLDENNMPYAKDPTEEN